LRAGTFDSCRGVPEFERKKTARLLDRAPRELS
jgi:hypothetical protein